MNNNKLRKFKAINSETGKGILYLHFKLIQLCMNGVGIYEYEIARDERDGRLLAICEKKPMDFGDVIWKEL